MCLDDVHAHFYKHALHRCFRCLDQDGQIEKLTNQSKGAGCKYRLFLLKKFVYDLRTFLRANFTDVHYFPPASDIEEKYRQLLQESARRENVLVMRLTAKDQEVQELMVRINYSLDYLNRLVSSGVHNFGSIYIDLFTFFFRVKMKK